MHNITDKIDLLYNKLTFSDNCTISDHQVNNNKSSYETIHSKFCKYTVNIPRHARTSGIFRELDRYPIAIKARVSNITYWHRLEMGTENSILQNAFDECKNNNYMFYQNNICLEKMDYDIFLYHRKYTMLSSFSIHYQKELS